MYRRILATVLLAAGVTAGAAQAATFLPISFTKITDNTSFDLSPQLRAILEVDDSNEVATFTLYNWNPAVGGKNVASSIAQVYVDDGGLLEEVQGMEDSGHSTRGKAWGVWFTSLDAKKKGPPSAGNAKPPFVADFAFGAVNPAPAYGVNNDKSEWLSLCFEIEDHADLAKALANGDLRLGLHVTSIDGGSSDSYVSGAPVPLPHAALLLATGVAGLGVFGRRKLKG